MKSDWEEGPQLMPACISKSPLHHYIGEPNSFWAEYKKECWNYLSNTEYKYTDNIKKQQIPKIQTMTFRDGAVAEEELWISRSLIPLIRLAFSFAIKVAAIYFPNMIYIGGIRDFYITVALQQLISCSSSTSLFVYKSNHLIGPSLSAFMYKVNKLIS